MPLSENVALKTLKSLVELMSLLPSACLISFFAVLLSLNFPGDLPITITQNGWFCLGSLGAGMIHSPALDVRVEVSGWRVDHVWHNA